MSQVVVSSWKENVQELVVVQGSVHTGVKLSYDVSAVFFCCTMNQVVLKELQDLCGSELSIFGRVENFEERSLVHGKLSHVRKNLPKSFDVALFNSGAFEQISD